MDVYSKAIPFRLFMGIIFAGFVYWTPTVRASTEEEFPYYYFFVMLSIYAIHQVSQDNMKKVRSRNFCKRFHVDDSLLSWNLEPSKIA